MGCVRTAGAQPAKATVALTAEGSSVFFLDPTLSSLRTDGPVGQEVPID